MAKKDAETKKGKVEEPIVTPNPAEVEAAEADAATTAMDENEEEQTNGGVELNRQAIVKGLLADKKAKQYRAKIRNAHVTIKDTYTMVSMTLDKKIPAYIADEDDPDTYVEGTSAIIFTSSIAVAAALKENQDTAFLGNTVNDNPKSLEALLPGGEITFLSQHVKADTDYVNPFTTQEDPEPTTFDHAVYLTHPIKIVLGSTGTKASQFALLDKMGLLNKMFTI